MISGLRVGAGLDALGRRLGDRPHLQGEEARHGEAQAHSTESEHGVRLVQSVDRSEQAYVGLLDGAALLGQRDPHHQICAVGQELVERRVEQPDRRGQPVHDRQQLDEVSALQWEQGVESSLLRLVGVSEDHPFDEDTAVAEEHVLGTAQPDPLGPEVTCPGRIVTVVGVGAHPETPNAIRVGQQPVDSTQEVCRLLIGGGQDNVEPFGEEARDG